MGWIDGIVQGISGGIQGVAAINETNVDDVCGKKPGIFTYKGKVKDDYNACLAEAREAKINAINASAENLKAQKESSKQKAWVVPVVIATVVIVLITSVVLIRRSKK